MKKLIVVTLFFGFIITKAFAGSELVDTSRIFNVDDSQSMDLAILSSDEMKETYGAVVPNSVLLERWRMNSQIQTNIHDITSQVTTNKARMADMSMWSMPQYINQ